MSREHISPSEHDTYQPAGRIRHADGSIDQAGTWAVCGTFTEKDSSGDVTEYVRLLKATGVDKTTISSLVVPVEEYHQWQLEPDVEDSESGLERFSPREQRVFAPLAADKLKRGYGEAPSREDVTEQKKQDALNVLGLALTREARLKQILRDRLQREDTEDDVLDALRHNDELRCTIGRYFMEKIPSLPLLPERVERNDPGVQKNPDYAGYISMSSHEYSALLALSMIDGSYDASLEDKTDYNEYGEPLTGQHRFTARELLHTYDD